MYLIKELRHKKGMTQQELSKLADVSLSHLRHIEKGRRKASLMTLVKIANALDVPLNKIFYSKRGNTYNGGFDNDKH